MKKRYFFLFLCASCLLGYAVADAAENEHRLVVEGTIWNIGVSRSSEVYCEGESVAYALLGDMELDGKLYKKLYAITDTTLTDDPLSGNHSLIGGYREENGRVWFLPKAHYSDEFDFYPERLAYDFTAQAGDIIERDSYTVLPYLPLDGNSISTSSGVKTHIISVTADSQERRRLTIMDLDNRNGVTMNTQGKQGLKISDYGYEEWIEGVGSKKGLFWANMTFIVSGGGLRSTELLCMKRNGKIMYLKEGCEKCFSGELDKDLVSIRGSINEKAEATLSPNPVKEDLNVTVPEQILPCVINLYSTTGEYVTGKRMTAASETLRMEGMESGLYLYRIATDGGELLDAGKVIKE